MGTAEVDDLARRYRESRVHRGGGAPDALVHALSNRYRARRWYRLEAIVTRLDELPEDGPATDASAAEALEHATRNQGSTELGDMATYVRWRAALFDVLVRDAMNAGERVADLRLRPGQRAVLVPTVNSTTLGITASSNAVWTAQQQRALDDLARVRDAVAAGHPLDMAMAPLPAADEWADLHTQLAARRSWRSTAV